MAKKNFAHAGNRTSVAKLAASRSLTVISVRVGMTKRKLLTHCYQRFCETDSVLFVWPYSWLVKWLRALRQASLFRKGKT